MLIDQQIDDGWLVVDGCLNQSWIGEMLKVSMYPLHVLLGLIV